MAEADAEAILKIFVDHGVDFVVIGASAAIMQGVPLRATLDLDVTPANTRRNLQRLAGALGELNARLRVSDADEGVALPSDARMLTNVSVLTLSTKHGPLDVLFAPEGSAPYKDLQARAAEVRPFGLAVKVAHLADLIAMKRAAGREKDAAHLTVLLEFVRKHGL
jgi:hypothetical protein